MIPAFCHNLSLQGGSVSAGRALGSHLGAVTQGFFHIVLASVMKVKRDLMDGSASPSGEQLEGKA